MVNLFDHRTLAPEEGFKNLKDNIKRHRNVAIMALLVLLWLSTERTSLVFSNYEEGMEAASFVNEHGILYGLDLFICLSYVWLIYSIALLKVGLSDYMEVISIFADSRRHS